MEHFWDIISKWEPLGQGVFFLIIVSVLVLLVKTAFFYVSVLLRGWPENHQAPEE